MLAGPDALERGTARCVWCERIRDLRREVDVEHYRPKAQVTRWVGSPPSVTDIPPSQVVDGDGYWWLAFSWENYSFSCKTCNQEWKRNLFPVQGTRPMLVEGAELHEAPLLLDPGKPFRTADHFSWTFDAYMEGVSAEGKATIITCGLNRRALVADRLKVAGNVGDVLGHLCAAYERRDVQAGQRWRKALADLGSRTCEYAGMVRWLADQSLPGTWDAYAARGLLPL